MMFTVDKVVESNLPNINSKPWLAKPTKALLRYLLNERECNDIAGQFSFLKGVDFVEQVLESFAVSYTVPDSEVETFPIRPGRYLRQSSNRFAGCSGADKTYQRSQA